MDDPNLINDVRYLRDVVAKTQPASVNRYWPVTLFWGCVVVLGYAVCMFLGMTGRMRALPWVWPVLIALAWPTDWYLRHKVRSRIDEGGIRPRSRKELLACWGGIVVIGMFWNAALVISGTIATQWGLLCFVWGSLYFVGFVVNSVLVSPEWWWAAGLQLVSMIAAFLAGGDYYWIPGASIGITCVLAGVLGRRNALRQPLPA